jgi:hypothetical protein
MTHGKETNELNNKSLMEGLGNAALSTLKQGEHYNNLTGLQVEFGYLFSIEGHGLEALFKMTTDKQTLYFAAQKSQLLMLNINETLFEEYTKVWYELHG